MSTKYILHGGAIRASQDKGKAYFEEIVKNLGDNPRLLLCFFAQPEEEWGAKYQEWKERITAALASIKPQFEMADRITYRQQAERNDVLFIFGGDDDLLLDVAKKTEGFIASLANLRVVTGSSAGAILLSDYSWCCDLRKVTRGLGIVPANVLVHFGSSSYGSDDPRGPIDWEKVEQELKNAVSNKYSIMRLHEGQFEIIEQ
ncbi:MAG: hypothetical protein V4702_00145 [Patescibacteria group bacterium]